MCRSHDTLLQAKALASDEEQEQLVAEVQAEIEAAKRASKKERIRQLLLAQELAAAANLEPPVRFRVNPNADMVYR